MVTNTISIKSTSKVSAWLTHTIVYQLQLWKVIHN